MTDTVKLLADSFTTPFVLPAYRNTSFQDVMNFAYSMDTPRISNRTAAESNLVARDLNYKYGFAGENKKFKDIQLFWKCINQPNTKNEENCLKESNLKDN